jgi:putative endonuclease
VRIKDAVGRYGEDVAAAHLRAAGMVILARNWRCRQGELDIIADDGGALVFCEVKTRSTVRFGTPVEAVSAVKAARIRRLAISWLIENRESADAAYWPQLRFDVVSVLRRRDGPPRVEHYPGAF